MKQLLTFFLAFSVHTAMANTIEVGRTKVITSLRKGIELAQPYDTVLVQKGVYREGNIVIGKPLYLIGVDEPTLDGEGKTELLTLTGRNIVVKGFSFLNSGYSAMNDFASVKVIDAENVILENNTVQNAYFAFHIANTTYSIIRNNTIKGNAKSEQTSGNGIHLWKCENMLVEDNHTEGHRDGIYFEFVTHSVIQNNYSTRNIRYGLHFMFSHNNAYMGNTFKDNGAGVAVMYSNKVLMHSNIFDHNWGPSAYGILLKEISDSRIIHNTFYQNTVAILMEGTNRIAVERNTFNANGWAMKVQASCDDNTFFHNNFLANTFDLGTNGTMLLNRFYSNYWDKYDGYDMNKNGLGDVPYHPVSMYSMVVERNPNSLLVLRSFMVSLLDKAEKAIPSLTPAHLTDELPRMKPIQL
ncbi:MAG TPA: nitrous oxide reductase family maturation protein NosD [Chitinophagaceae bacterium]